METVFAASAKEVISPVISFGQLPPRSTLAFVIEKGEKSITVLYKQLGLVKKLEERPKRDLAFIKIIFKTDLHQLTRQLP